MDFLKGEFHEGRSKTAAGEGRVIPLNQTALQAICGHMSRKIQGHYSHVGLEAKRRAVEALDGIKVEIVQ